nr:transposase [Streptomyces sp. FxanaA7]
MTTATAGSACYQRGLMRDRRRNSVQPMAERLSDGNMQALQRIVERLSAVVGPEVWVINDMSFLRCGTA